MVVMGWSWSGCSGWVALWNARKFTGWACAASAKFGEVGELETAAGGYRGIKKGRAKELGLYDYGVADFGESRGRRCDFQWWRK